MNMINLLRELKGSTLIDVEMNSDGYTVLYLKDKDGEVYAVNLYPTVRHLGQIGELK